MRKLLIAAAAVAMAGLTSAAPANATYWACQGGHVACGGESRSAAPSKSSYKKASHKKTKSYESADSSYSGGSKKKKKRVTYSGSSGYSSGGGLASYYWQPQRVASGGWFNPNALTAAHKTLPFGTKVRVTNRHNGKSVVVTINDRGPYVKGRVIDLSSRAAGVIGMKGSGVVPVSLAVLGR
ncbi:MAG: septal ring lytic transglycosylase RlpA family protein [Hyphomicrobiaceae bacterium]|nr:septal ring lytic transglycosylase RlpA family protein [Hyphomicrobiaceae bacterium]MCC0007055.1 septal ring lytic transglycosylase RlpA family protein [Hyphomicrobiaceae bacterium]